MNVFVDEAGIFVIPQNNKSTVSCVGALVLPESSTTEIFNCFEKLKESWGEKNGGRIFQNDKYGCRCEINAKSQPPRPLFVRLSAHDEV